jgi:16S rRNA processing protein RimM
MIREYLEIGTIVGTHGIHGELRVSPACDSPEFFAGFDVLYYDARGQRPVRVLGARPHKNLALLRLEGVGSMEAAQALRNKTLFFRRADARLEEGRYFIAELLGCEVFDSEDPGLRYGVISDVSQTGANDVWHIQTPGGGEMLIPVIGDVVKNVDIIKGRIEIVMLNGLMEA